MRLKGNFSEFQFLVRLAIGMESDFIYFTPEGKVWLSYGGGKTLYLKSKIDASHNIILSWDACQNLELAIPRLYRTVTGKNAGQRRVSFHLEPDFFQVGNLEEGKIRMRTDMEQAPMYSQFVERFETLNFLNYVPGTPQMKISAKVLREYEKDIRFHYMMHDQVGGIRQTLKPDDDERRNVLQLDENEELSIIRQEKNLKVPPCVHHYAEDFFIQEKYWEYSFYLSDTDIQLLIQLDGFEKIEEFRILLYKDYYVIDVHNPDLKFKMWHARKKRTQGALMLQE